MGFHPDLARSSVMLDFGDGYPRLISGPEVASVIVVVLAAAGVAVWMLNGKGGDGEAAPKPTPTLVAGEVLDVDAVSVNLADGHYLRLGLALQLST